MSKRIDFGPVLPIHRGDWQAGVTYERLNTVRYKSASWVCKALSTTAEPTTGSTDWFLQVEDSVSVASVNGQTGVVTITNTLSTPAIDDDSTLIANTAWVTDKIEQTVSDIDTSILAQASANTSTAIANAVSQMTTANDNKFATKLDLDVVRANYATKNDLASVSTVANAALPASKITYGTTTLEAGVSTLADGVIYFVYE